MNSLIFYSINLVRKFCINKFYLVQKMNEFTQFRIYSISAHFRLSKICQIFAQYFAPDFPRYFPPDFPQYFAPDFPRYFPPDFPRYFPPDFLPFL